jgi:hypothetical protein
MSIIVAVCGGCGDWLHIWGASRRLHISDATPPALKKAMRYVADANPHCPTCFMSLVGSTAQIKDLPTELRPYDVMTDRSRQALEWRAAGHDYPCLGGPT